MEKFKEGLEGLIGIFKYEVSDEYANFICKGHPVGFKRDFGGVSFEIVQSYKKADYNGIDDSYDSYEPSSYGTLEVIFKAGDKFYRETGRYNSYESDWAGLGKPVEMIATTRTITTYGEAKREIK